MTPNEKIRSILDNVDELVEEYGTELVDELNGKLYRATDDGNGEDCFEDAGFFGPCIHFSFGPSWTATEEEEAIIDPTESSEGLPEYLSDTCTCYDWMEKVFRTLPFSDNCTLSTGEAENMHSILLPEGTTKETAVTILTETIKGFDDAYARIE